MQLQDPTDDPKLPSYRHPTLVEITDDLKRAYDAFNLMRGVKKEYLPKEAKEPEEAYKARLDRSVFADFFRGSIVAFAGVLSKFTVSDAPQTLIDSENNVDQAGNSLTAFLQNADIKGLRDGACLIQVDIARNTAQNRAAEIAQGIKPYLVLRERAKVLNWYTTIVEGVEILEQVTILELKEVRDPPYGVKFEPRYRVIDRKGWQVYKIERQGSTIKAVEDPEDQGSYVGAGDKPLSRIPIVWYPPDGASFGQGSMLLGQVVEHSIEHWRMRSDLREKDHKCNMPVPVRIGAVPPAPGMPPEPCVLGPNTIIDLQPGGSFDFKEPAATSLKETREQIADVEKLISRQTLGFLYGDPGATKTATQAGLEGAQTEATVKSVAEQKASMVQSIMAIWCEFTGEELSPEAGIQMDASLFKPPMTSADSTTLQSLTGGEKIMSKRSAIEQLQEGGILSATTTADDELQRIQEEEPPPAEEPGMNSYGAMPPES